MNWISFYFTIFILGIGIDVFGQHTTAEYFNISGIIGQETSSLDALNSKEIEFAPGFFREGILFVQANSEKKRIKKGADIHFRLMFSAKEKTGTFSKPVVFDSIFTEGAFEGPFCYVPEEKLLMVSRNQSSMHESDDFNEMKLGIYFYTFIENEWQFTGSFPGNHKDFNVCHPAYDPVEKALIFASDKPGGYGGLDLYRVQRTDEVNWTKPVNLGENVNSPGNDCFPFIYNGDFLFYSSEIEDTDGSLDVYASVKVDGDWLKSFAMPEPVNSPYDDLGLIVDSSGKHLYFASSRRGGMGRDDLYHMQLDDAITIADPGFHVVRVYENMGQNPLSGTALRFYKFEINKVEVINDDNTIAGVNYKIDSKTLKASAPVYTDINGEIAVSLPKGEYIMEARRENYFELQKLIKIDQKSELISVGLDSITCKNIHLLITNADNADRLEDAVISFDNEIIKTDDQGEAPVCVSRDKALLVKIRRDGFQQFDIILEYEGLANDEEIVIAMRPSEIFTEELPVYSGEFTVLENILYEYNRSDLDEKARDELNRLAKHMITYPMITIELSAHTDSRGGEVYNQRLSDERARKAKEYLMERGIENWRIAAIGYGESRLRNACSDGIECSEEQHAINRRTEVRVLAGHNGQ